MQKRAGHSGPQARRLAESVRASPIRTESSHASFRSRIRRAWYPVVEAARRLGWGGGLTFTGLTTLAIFSAELHVARLITAVTGVLLVVWLITSGSGLQLLQKHRIKTFVAFALFVLGVGLFSDRMLDRRYSELPTLGLPTLSLPNIPWDLSALDANISKWRGMAQVASTDKPAAFKNEFSIIIAARDEDEFLAQTIKYTIQNTPSSVIREIVVVDDRSKNRVEDVLNEQLTPQEKRFVKVVRFDTRQGLIRARIVGADASTAQNIFFMDGHCRPKPGWHTPLLQGLRENYKRLVCPIIQDIHRETWEDVGTSGMKMMFSWDFEFDWYDDFTDEVPVSAGGILGITRRWWEESGKYDPGMREWGAENMEQSMRVWMCGGEIKVFRNAFIGHIFDRPPKPNPGGSLVRQVQTNQKRAALVWLDDYYTYFETVHSVVKGLDEGDGLEERMLLRKKLGCQNFEWYVNRFRTAFERKGLLFHHFHNLQHTKSTWCLTANGAEEKEGDLELRPCNKNDQKQRWQAVAGGRMLYNQKGKTCVDRGGVGAGDKAIAYTCDWNNVFQMKNRNQLWLVEPNSGRILTHFKEDYSTLDGNDFYVWDPKLAADPKSLCLTSSLIVTAENASKLRAAGKSKELSIERCDPDRADQQWNWLW